MPPLARLSPIFAGPSLLLVLLAAPGQAGSVTAESVWDRSNAIQRARSQLPAGASVTGTTCTAVNVRDGNDRWICTLDFTIPASSPSPSAPSAPVP